MSALENKLNWIKQCAELLLKDVNLAIGSYEEEQKHKKIWMVWFLDESWYYERWFTKIFNNRDDAYKYYKEEAEHMLNEYNKNHKNVIKWFDERTLYCNNDYPEFRIDNHWVWDCQTIYEYEEVNLQWFNL